MINLKPGKSDTIPPERSKVGGGGGEVPCHAVTTSKQRPSVEMGETYLMGETIFQKTCTKLGLNNRYCKAPPDNHCAMSLIIDIVYQKVKICHAIAFEQCLKVIHCISPNWIIIS